MELNDSIFDSLWTKKYAPSSIDEMVLSDDIRTIVDQYIDAQDIPSLLFCGRPGQGKTTLAVNLCKAINATTLMINASFDNGIDIIRGKINNFVSAMSPTGSLKVVILDEADRLSIQSQDALRGMIEDNAVDTRFILTANEQSRLTDAIKSRCVSLDIMPPKDKFKAFLVKILRAESIVVSKETVKPLQIVINKYYPDLRRTIGVIQKNVISNKLVISDSEINDSITVEIFDALTTENPIEIRKLWIPRENEFQGDYQFILKQLHSYTYNKNDIDPLTRANIILEISDGLRDSTFVIDQELNFYATIIRIMRHLQKF